MPDLPDSLYDEVTRLSELGNEYADDSQFDFAINSWRDALALLPAPIDQWDAASWLHASIGDANWQAGRPKATKEAMFDALNCVGGVENAFIHFRLGQAAERLGERDLAVQSFMKAYMLDGDRIFEADPEGAAALELLGRSAKL
jgi:tetratricopeptide (TPR) repeat protein